jgi:phage gp29-like protein
MQRDPQVRACLTTKRLAVLSEAVEVHPADQSAAAVRAADVVRDQMASIPGGAGGIVAGALDALAMGCAIGEYVWNLDGTLGRIRWHDPRRFQFAADGLGDVVELVLLDAGVRFPAERFVVYSYQSRYGNPYGESDLVSAYRPWAQKDAVQRMWLSALDRFGAPTPVARVPQTWQQTDIDHLSGLLARLQSDSSLVVTDDVAFDATFFQGRIEPAKAFDTAALWCDTQIARAILGQELTTQGSSGGAGSYALGKVHQDVADDWIQALRAEIAECLLTGQVARQICTMAVGPDAPCPVVRFANLTPEEMDRRRSLVQALLTGGVVQPTEGWIRSWLGIPAAGAEASA